ncbi:MAG TPA: 4-hydroxy-tetrahydrodipicolinate synthase, partial [Armatimonadetes bacterium]|nr:4-hydroxy-tetrahydrodipicolinate synthase [Armatimonadota bacterium]
TLTKEEKTTLFRVVKEAAQGRGAVIAGTGSYNTAESIALTQAAEEIGVDGVMLVCPYYNKPPQRALIAHFRTIAEATSLPVILYNVPSRTGRNVEAATTCTLAQVENIVAIKEASGDLAQIAHIVSATPADFLVYSGDDAFTLPLLAVGGYGVVSVASHVAGREMKELITAFHQGNPGRAGELHRRLLPLFEVLFLPSSVNPAPVKAALNLLGHSVGGLRLPLLPLNEEETAQVRQVLESLELL